MLTPLRTMHEEPHVSTSLPARFWAALKASVLEWLDQGVFHWGAALAFYSIFSLTPLLLLGLTGLGTFLHAATVRAKVVDQAARWLGDPAEEVVGQVVEQISLLSFDSLIIIPTVVMLLFGATAIFANIQAALNDIWRLRPQSGIIRNVLRTRALAVVMVFILGAVMGLSVLLSTVSQLILPHVPDSLAATLQLGRVVEVGLTLVVLWLLLGLTFAILPDAEISWRDVWVGAGVTAILLYLGKLGLGIYLGAADLGSAFGTAGSVFTLLVWIYYSAQIFFLGAVFTRVWSDLHGGSIQPEPHAAFVETRPVGGEGDDATRNGDETATARDASSDEGEEGAS